MELDVPLLLSVVGGLGSHEEQPDKSKVYIRDEDCTGNSLTCSFMVVCGEQTVHLHDPNHLWLRMVALFGTFSGWLSMQRLLPRAPRAEQLSSINTAKLFVDLTRVSHPPTQPV